MINTPLAANDSIDVQGHRGARAILPENTLPAFKYALELGVDTIELDMGVSKDGIVVVSHDQRINTKLCQHQDGRAIKKPGLIHQLTLEQLKSYDCGSKKNSRFPKQTPVPGTQIPTLAEVFELVINSNLAQAKKVRFNIETKSDPDKPGAQPAPDEYARLVLNVVQKYQMQHRVTIQSFDHRTLSAVRKQAPKIELAALFAERQKDWVAAAKQANAEVVSPNHQNIHLRDVAELQAAGFKVIPWTANKKKHWAALVKMGVDGIITDDPEPLLEFLGRR